MASSLPFRSLFAKEMDLKVALFWDSFVDVHNMNHVMF